MIGDVYYVSLACWDMFLEMKMLTEEQHKAGIRKMEYDYDYEDDVPMLEMVGKVFVKVERRRVNDDDFLTFTSADGIVYDFYYSHDCCATCEIESIVGDLNDLVGEPLLTADLVTSGDKDEGVEPKDEYDDSFTWSFYKFATRKGYVDVRWYGSSNGYYSETVTLRKYEK